MIINNHSCNYRPPQPDMIKELIRNTQDTQLMIDLAVAQETQKLELSHDHEVRSKNDRITQLEALLSEEKELTSKLKTDLDMKLSLINKNRQTIQELQILTTELTQKLSLVVRQREQERAIAQATIQQATQSVQQANSQVPVSSSSEFEQPSRTNTGYSYNQNNSNNKVVPKKNTVNDEEKRGLPNHWDHKNFIKPAKAESKTLLNNAMGDRESLTSSQMFANTTIATPSLREGLTPLPIEVHDKVAILKNDHLMIAATDVLNFF